MNKWQLIVLGIMVVAICIVIFTAPKYVLVQGTYDRLPYRVYSDQSNYDHIKVRFGSTIEWDTITYICIPILLIGGFFILILRKSNIDKVLEMIERKRSIALNIKMPDEISAAPKIDDVPKPAENRVPKSRWKSFWED